MSVAAQRAPHEMLFLRNMRALWRTDPALALRVDAVHDDERPALEPTRSGHRTAKVYGSGSEPIYLHSRYDPITEAQRFIASVSLEDKHCFVVAGMGLGYHLRALWDRLGQETFIICTEPSLAHISAALTCVDLSEAIASDRLLIFTEVDKARLHQRVKERNTLMMLGAQFIRHPPSLRLAEAAQGAMVRMITDFVTYTRMTLITLVSNARITCENIAMNLCHHVTTPPIDLLKNRFAGDPAVLIAAGPSLVRNIDQLKSLKGRAVLCAVQTVLRPMMARGVTPDFVTSLDFHEMSARFFEGVGDLGETHLVAEPKATWHVLDHYPGPISLLDNPWVRTLIGDELGGRDGLRAGATVAHLAFYLAVYMGCDPIIFVGQDLAFTGHLFYIPGVEAHRAWRGELNRFNTIEQKEWERIARNRPILQRVPAARGGELLSDELLTTYLEQFEKDIAGAPCRVINATEGGAAIRGTETTTLAAAAERFCARPLAPERFAYRTSTRWRDVSRVSPVAAEVRRRIAELQEAVELCGELLDLFDELDGMTHDVQRFNRRLVRVDELRTRIHQESRAYRLVNLYTQLAELRRFTADRRIHAADNDDAERAKRQIARDRDFITGVRDGAKDLRPILERALERLRAMAVPPCA